MSKTDLFLKAAKYPTIFLMVGLFVFLFAVMFSEMTGTIAGRTYSPTEQAFLFSHIDGPKLTIPDSAR